MIRIPCTRRGVSMRSLKRLGAFAVFAAAVPIVVLGASAAGAAGPNTSFAFNARDITGTSGAVTLTGGGAFNSSATHPPTPEAASAAPHRWAAVACSPDVRRDRASAGTATLSCRHELQVLGERGPQAREHQRRHRRAARRLLPSRRRNQRVVPSQHGRLGARHR